MLEAMVEKVAEELPRRSPEEEPMEEQAVVTYDMCSFFVRELSRMYNKDFWHVAEAAKNAQEEEMKRAQAAGSAQVSEITQAMESAQISSDSEPSKNAQAPASSPAPGTSSTVLTTGEYDLIYFMLHILGHVTSMVEECGSARLSKDGCDLRTCLGKEGLLALVVGTLRGLWELEQAAKAKKEKVDFASGYKRELMAIIANMCYANKRNQDEMRELGGVQLVLNHCNIDDNNPFIREWALFAVRNLLDDNPENQAIVQNLRAERVADTHGFLQQMGMTADIVNGVLKFKKGEPPK